MRQKRFAYFQTIGDTPRNDDLLVNLTIYDIPGSLVKEFAQTIVQSHNPGGVSDAIKDLMSKAIEAQKQKENKVQAVTLHFPS
jgi:hypothetical protein